MTTIKDFLLSRALQDEAESDVRSRAFASPSRGEGEPPAARHIAALLTEFRDAIEQHNDHTMTVVSRSGMQTVTRCGFCPKEDTRPCRALKVMALRYSNHPAYLAEWRIL